MKHRHLAPLISSCFWIVVASMAGCRAVAALNDSPTVGTGEGLGSGPDAPASTDATPVDDDGASSKPVDFSKFRVCGASAAGELFRFPLEHTCPDTSATDHQEGILLVIKPNIVPHIFKVRKYSKAVTVATVWRGFTETAITNRFTSSHPVPIYETRHIDTIYQCFNGLKVVTNGVEMIYVDRDGSNQTVHLQPIEGLTGNIRRYASQPKLYTDAGWLWGTYRRRTTVNCEIVDMTARSTPPFDFFVTAVGDTVETSPFPRVHDNGQLPLPPGVSVHRNYSLVDFSNRGTVSPGRTRVFYEGPTYTVSWDAEENDRAYCPLKIWRSFSRTIRTNQTTSFHFVANSITATFTTPLEMEANFTETHPCLEESIREEIELRFKGVSSSHEKDGELEYYRTGGGLYVVWQPLKQLSLKQAELEAAGTAAPPANGSSGPVGGGAVLDRRRRQAEEDPADNVLVPQIQFAYDSVRNNINRILEDLARAWCREQSRASHMWFEISKINPTSVMSSIYERPVSAKILGDVISVSECVTVDQASVSIHKSLRTEDKNTCYSRPQVTFKFLNGTTVFVGQLGMRNEILLSQSMIETCEEGNLKYIQAGNDMHVYRDYVHSFTVPLTNISTLDTFIALNTSFMENIDFKTVDLYSRDERRLSSVFDIETMFREYNYYTQRLNGLRRDLDNNIENNRDRVVESFGAIMEDLGVIGKTVVNAASSLVTFFGSIVTGFVNFVKHPLGGMLIILVIVAVIVILFLVNRKAKAVYDAPVRLLYPNVDRDLETHKVQPIADDELDKILAAMHARRQDVANKKPDPGTKDASGDGSRFDRLRQGLRNRWGWKRPSYSRLNSDSSVNEDSV